MSEPDVAANPKQEILTAISHLRPEHVETIKHAVAHTQGGQEHPVMGKLDTWMTAVKKVQAARGDLHKAGLNDAEQEAMQPPRSVNRFIGPQVKGIMRDLESLGVMEPMLPCQGVQITQKPNGPTPASELHEALLALNQSGEFSHTARDYGKTALQEIKETATAEARAR